jgi:hypothetical protein
MEKKAASWWDKLGVPQYGDEMVIRINRDVVNFDPYFTEGLTGIYGAWLERLVADDWTVNPEEWDYQIAWHPAKYQKGNHHAHRPFTQRRALAEYPAGQRPRVHFR